MKFSRRSIFYCVLLFCPASAAAAGIKTPPCEAMEPSEWQARIDKEPAAREPEAGGVAAVDEERVAPARLPFAVPTPLATLPADATFRQSYEDVYRILSAENECSRFYGGAAPAAYVFNQLAPTFKSARIGGGRMAGRMGGGTINVTHAPTGLKFRLFERAVLNTAGPFYRRQGERTDETVPRVGGHAPDTRGARALILLHELGHVVRGAGGRWLLADDGENPEESERNTALVEKHCGRQLKALGVPPRPAEVAAKSAREHAVRDTSEQ